MAKDFFALPESTAVRDAITRIQEEHARVETAFYLYITDQHQRLRGVCSLRDLVTAQPDTALSMIMTRDTFSVAADTDQEEVAVGFLLGFVYGVLLGALAHIGYQMWPLGLLVALAVGGGVHHDRGRGGGRPAAHDLCAS